MYLPSVKDLNLIFHWLHIFDRQPLQKATNEKTLLHGEWSDPRNPPLKRTSEFTFTDIKIP